MSRRVDLYISIVIIFAGLAYLYLATLINLSVKDDPIGERGLPYALGGTFVLGGLILSIRNFRQLRRVPELQDRSQVNEPGDEEEYPASSVRPMLVWVVFAIWAAAVEPIGFLIATPVCVGIGMWILGFRHPVRVVVLSIFGVLLIWFVFDFLLQIDLPGGVLSPLTDRLQLRF